MTALEPSVIEAILDHMNAHHAHDNLTIVQGHGHPAASDATLLGYDLSCATWLVEEDGVETEVTIPWEQELTDRASVRRQIIALHDTALERAATAR